MADRPMIAVVADDPGVLRRLIEDLGRRFEPDFRVVGVSSLGADGRRVLGISSAAPAGLIVDE